MKTIKNEIYFSVDIETDGPIPGPYSMLSFGCVAFTKEGEEIESFEANLKCLPTATQDKDTMDFWQKNPDAWSRCRKNCIEPEQAIKAFIKWVENIANDRYFPVMVCMPAGFDFTFMYWYMINFAGYSPFSFSCIDVKSYSMSMRKTPYRRSSKRFWPKRWFPNEPHTHVAIDDAREQGLTFINMLKENEGRPNDI